MKTSRGRLSMFQLLNSEKNISKHLLETKLFSKQSLIYFLQKYKEIVIKPVFGPSEINVTSRNSEFRISSEAGEIEAANIEDVYNYIFHQKTKENHYIIQPKILHSQAMYTPYHYLITAHRGSISTEWFIVAKTKKSIYLSELSPHKPLIQKMDNISVLIAQKLSNHFPECNTIVIEIVASHEIILVQDVVLHLPITKWSQFHSLNTIAALSPYVPITELLTESTFLEFLHHFNEVIIKPCQGQQGFGVLQISKKDSSSFEIHEGRNKQKKSSFTEAFHYIKTNYLSKKEYLIQPKIPLASINDCPMDIRIVVQKWLQQWKITGKIVKVAAKDFIITNAAQKLLSVENALINSTVSQINKKMLAAKMENICLFSAKSLEKVKPGISIIGFDIGISINGEIWIIEANYRPDLSMFYRTEDKTIYRNIKRNI